MSPEEHIEPEEIARLAEGGPSPKDAEPLLAHLSRCRSCMAAYAEAVRYRAAWLAERSAFEPPANVLAHARAAVRAATPRRRTWPRRLLQTAGCAAAVWLVVTLVGRSGRQPWDRVEALPPAVAKALAEQTHLTRGLFVPGAEAVRVRFAGVYRGSTSEDLSEIVDSLYGVYSHAPAGRSRERAGFCYASALVAKGSDAGAREVVEDLLKSDPRDCACRSLAAELEYPRWPDRAEKLLREAMAAGCRDDLTRMNLAIVRQARGDTVEARRTFLRLAGREDALGDRAREELERSAQNH
jgi:uncharacterized protein YecE (DUF72 family)